MESWARNLPDCAGGPCRADHDGQEQTDPAEPALTVFSDLFTFRRGGCARWPILIGRHRLHNQMLSPVWLGVERVCETLQPFLRGHLVAA